MRNKETITYRRNTKKQQKKMKIIPGQWATKYKKCNNFLCPENCPLCCQPFLLQTVL